MFSSRCRQLTAIMFSSRVLLVCSHWHMLHEAFRLREKDGYCNKSVNHETPTSSKNMLHIHKPISHSSILVGLPEMLVNLEVSSIAYSTWWANIWMVPNDLVMFEWNLLKEGACSTSKSIFDMWGCKSWQGTPYKQPMNVQQQSQNHCPKKAAFAGCSTTMFRCNTCGAVCHGNPCNL